MRRYSKTYWGIALAATLTLALRGGERLLAQEATPITTSASSDTNPSVSQVKKAPHLLPDSGVGPEYQIGPEDVLEITVFQVKDLDETVRVSNDGTIAVPLLGRIVASGLTPDQLRKELEQAYGMNYLQNPQVSVFVKEFHAQPISIIGAVQKPGLYQITGPRSLVEALSLAGGLSSGQGAAPGKTLYVTRPGGFPNLHLVPGMQLVAPNKIEININNLLYTRGAGLDIPIRPHDVIAVSKASVIYVAGSGVRKPGGFVLEDRDEVSVIQAMAMAEGLVPDAAKHHARIIHTKADGSRVDIPVDIESILKQKAPDPNLAANDILYIPLSGGKAALRKSTQEIVQTVSGFLIFHP
ncbi:MAG TPA: polysaccharide biosynthesis/export family protein [Terriglobia bacterium]|nr:polysaccharide biosynthesis/export family protein [Terriglobia bacterium]